MAKRIVSMPVDTYGKMFSAFLMFIDRVRAGEKTIIFGRDYVVIDRKTYNEYWNERKARMNSLSIIDQQ